ncbi:2OG-Fe(II) oxygenase [Sphingosinicella terrae]|uniref:2OG-Fe(II) oxygenase n=1 Tax=Sphingosinicella terrae TaxID=2172047 RepID=UPI000E0DA20E|nr:2OG-Fe(II) oxygenase family protein [Sphingosinicella terrae]
MAAFSLAEGLDADRLAPMFARAGRLQIDGFLDGACAAGLLRALSSRRDWVLTLNKGERILDYREAALAALDPADRAALSQEVVRGARAGFQFCYDTIRLPPRGEVRPAGPLAALEAFLCSSAMIAFFRAVTGFEDIAFADVHASRYSPGHFLTAHDDRIDAQHRRAAYVLNLTPDWRAEYGGLLLFHERDGNVSRGFMPRFNALTLFAVPQAHSVSYVNPIAPHPRYAVTGWLRADPAG